MRQIIDQSLHWLRRLPGENGGQEANDDRQNEWMRQYFTGDIARELQAGSFVSPAIAMSAGAATK